jgi:hypothetical protein
MQFWSRSGESGGCQGRARGASLALVVRSDPPSLPSIGLRVVSAGASVAAVLPPGSKSRAAPRDLWESSAGRGGSESGPNTSLQATTPAAFTSARFARLRFGLRVLRLSSMPFGVRRG